MPGEFVPQLPMFGPGSGRPLIVVTWYRSDGTIERTIDLALDTREEAERVYVLASDPLRRVPAA